MRFNFKKGEGLSMNVMIVAILCIIVLVVIVIIFVNGTNKGQKQLDSCIVPGSVCVDDQNQCCNEKGDKGVAVLSGCKGKDEKGNDKGYCCSVVLGTATECSKVTSGGITP
jgi:hypothetical protein